MRLSLKSKGWILQQNTLRLVENHLKRNFCAKLLEEVNWDVFNTGKKIKKLLSDKCFYILKKNLSMPSKPPEILACLIAVHELEIPLYILSSL
jgi:hypothetical protein